MKQLQRIYKILLTQYGRQPWWPGESPFEIMLGSILTQNTRWDNVEKALSNLKSKRGLRLDQLLQMSTQELEDCIKPAGCFRIKAQRLQIYIQWYESQGGYNGLQKYPTHALRSLLLKIHGIGPETADDILLYALGRPVFIVDVYTRRLFQRLSMIQGKEPYEALQAFFESNLPRHVDLYQQYHALIVQHAKLCCRKRQPLCEVCPLREQCAHRLKPYFPQSLP